MIDGDSTPQVPLRDQLQVSLGDSYILEGEIGGSGMSRVFIANEPALGRKVVIKVLTPELASEISAERFAREIRLAASLQQANIVPLLSAGTAAGLPYYTMPLVEGRSLRDRIARDGSLPIAEGLGILRDVARALAYAHAHGVVHRDIKPGNVLLSGGTAVVTDFGIAKALGAARDSGDAADATALTRTGMAIGTPAYMAPEQATGDPATDHRADLYAFGCVAYEVLTGHPPFHGAPSHQIIAAHFSTTPPSISEQRAEVPHTVAELVARCLAKAPQERPATAEDVLAALDEATTQPTVVTRPRRYGLVVAGVAVVVVSLVTGALMRRSRNGAASEPVALGAIPFTNLAHDTALDYLSDGVSDEILTGLQQMPGVRILNRQMAYAYKGRNDVDVRTMAHNLSVQFLITGSLHEGNGQLTISVQLNDAGTGGELWANTFGGTRNDLPSVTTNIVRTLSDTLRALFPDRFPTTPRVASNRGTSNGAAYDAYLLGLDQLKRRSVQQSVTSFEHAIALDTGFARAHAALAMALQFYPYFVGVPPAQVRDSTMAEARGALRLDSTLADAHTALGAMYAHAAQWDSSDAEFLTATQLEPDNFEAHHTWARFLLERGREADAVQQLDLARGLERTSALVSGWRAYAFFLERQRDSAVAELERARQIDSTNLAIVNFGGSIYLALGRKDDARRVMPASTPPPQLMSIAPYLYAMLGDTATGNRLVNVMESTSPRPWFADVERALVSLATGDTAAALSALERSDSTSGPMWTIGPLPAVDPLWNPVRQSPRFVALLRRANLDLSRQTTLDAHRQR